MFESLTTLLHSSEASSQEQGILLLSSLEPKSHDDLTEGFETVIAECEFSDGTYPGAWFNFHNDHQMHIAMYILHDWSPEEQITTISLHYIGENLPPLPYVEVLKVWLNNDSNNCTEYFEMQPSPSVKTLEVRGRYMNVGIMHVPKFTVPNLHRLEVDSPWYLDGLHHYKMIKELGIPVKPIWTKPQYLCETIRRK